jgi:iron complex outermembrane recepter protein
MKFRLKAIPAATAGAISLATAATFLSGQTLAQTPTPAPALQKVEKIEVTGSNIKRIDTETVAPVQIVTREEIQASGRSTIAEVLGGLSINQGNSFNEAGGVNSFAPGASGISLRGLGAKNTLLLVNGRRLASYGFAQGISDTFVDVNAIPAAAVDRIEILKAGASHIYGSDAIAGVINVILRKDFQGLELSAGGATSTQGGANEYRASLAAGIGDLGKNKYNVLVSADYFKRDLLLQTERDFTKENDYRDQIAGDFARPGIAVYIPTGAAGAAPNPNRIAFPGCTGQVLTVREINVFTTLRGNNCVQNFAAFNTLNPRTERMGLLARGTLDFSSNLQAYVEAGYSTSKSFQKFQPPFIGTANTFLNPATGLPASVPGLIPASSPYAYLLNGVPTASLFQYVFTEAGGRDADIKSDTSRFLAGLKGTLGSWDWEAGAVISQNKVTRIGYNTLLSGPTIAVLNNSTYNYFDRNSAANAAVLRGLLTSTTRVSTSKLQTFDIKASTELFQTPNGPIGFSVGAETRKESILDVPDLKSRDGSIFGAGSVAVDGDRRNSAIFTELNGKPFKNFELQAAVRYEKYSDFGNKTVPGIGAKLTITPELLLRSTFSKGFRAPTLPENSKSNALFFITVTDPVLNETYQTSGAQTGSGTLKPETSDNYTWGALWEPSKDTSFGIDFYQINQKDIVSVDDFSFILRNPNRYPGAIIRSPTTNRVLSITARYVNVAVTETGGFDIEGRHNISLGEYGKLGLAANYSYISSYKYVLAEGEEPTEAVDSNDFATLPRYRGNISATWERGDWTVRLSNRHIAGYDQTGVTSLPQQTRVGASDFQDLFVRYSGFKNLSLTASVLNLRDSDPPYDGAAGNRFATSLYDLKGRYISIGAAYSFK